jgi:hypothetical protein
MSPQMMMVTMFLMCIFEGGRKEKQMSNIIFPDGDTHKNGNEIKTSYLINMRFHREQSKNRQQKKNIIHFIVIISF